MSKPAVRKGDKCTGHGDAKPRACVQGSPDVFINGKPAHRQGDMWGMHKSHTSKLARGSSSVFVNGKGQARVGDPVLCGSRCAQGSPNVFVGDAGGTGGGAAPAATMSTADLGDPERFVKAGGYSGSGTIDTESGVEGINADSSNLPDDPQNGPIDASDDDIDWLTTCMMDEALNQKTHDAWAAVAQVVVTRTRTGKNAGVTNPAWKGSLKGTVLASDQFSGFYFDFVGRRYSRVVARGDWAKVEIRGKKKMAKYRASSAWNSFHAVAQQVVNGNYNGGAGWQRIKNVPATMYVNLAISNPAWARQSSFVTRIEGHSFFRG